MSSSTLSPVPKDDAEFLTRPVSLPGDVSNYQSLESSRSTSPFPLRRAMTSFDNLVALANYQERAREARKLIWRDKGEPVAELADVNACLEHAATGGLRAATLAFSIRAGFNLVLALIRIRNIPKKQRLALIQRAIIGSDTWRFAGMLGTFVSVYKFLLNALPLLIPAIKPKSSIILSKSTATSTFDDEESDDRQVDIEDDLEAGITFPRVDKSILDVPIPTPNRREARLSLSAHAQMVLIRKKTRRWHAALAGAIAGGLAIMWEKKSRRLVIAQQMFVRGLQGSYNAYTTKRNIHIPYGSVIVFSLACGQILYGWLMRPDTLPRSYTTWVVNASKVSPEAIKLNRDLVRQRSMDIADLEKVMSLPYITPENRRALLDFKESYLYPSPDVYFPYYAPCPSTHPGQNTCWGMPIDRFLRVFRWMLPIYGALHFIPTILFKRNQFMKDPLQMLLKASWGTCRSSAFLGTFVIIYQTFNCGTHQLHEYLSKLPSSSRFKLPRKVLDSLLISSATFWIPGLLSGLALFVEERKRRAELAMYVLPKALESAWIVARGKVGMKPWRGGEGILTVVGMSLVMATYQNDPQHLSGLVRRILYQFIGPN